MPTEEDIAFERIMQRLAEKQAIVLSAHPPSGKSYDTELIRIPARDRNAGRYHLDLIFVLNEFLYLVELKGRLSESSQDILKLRKLLSEYSLSEILRFVRKRVNRKGVNWEEIRYAVPTLGCTKCDCSLPADFAVLEATSPDRLVFFLGNRVEQQLDCHNSLFTTFDSE
jgi:hypothetical protein